jgi:C_GCAxxG_C_C family probable redox protein
MSNVDLALACFKEGCNCSQAVFSAYAPTLGPTLGLDRETALRVAAPFGGGMGRTGETCGAVSGALMVIGLRHGQFTTEDKDAKERTYELATEFLERFAARNNGCVKCRDLLGYDVGNPEDRQAARDQGLFETRCPKFVRDAAEIVEQLL